MDRIDTAVVGAGPVRALRRRARLAQRQRPHVRRAHAHVAHADAARHAAALRLGAHEPLGARAAPARSRPGCGAARPSASSRCRCSTSCATPSGSSARFVPESDPGDVGRHRARRRRRARDDGGRRRGAGPRRRARARRHAVPARAARARRAPAIRASASCSSAAATRISPASAWPSSARATTASRARCSRMRAEAASVELLVRSRVRWFAEREPHAPRGPVRQRLYDLAYPGRRLRAAADQPLRDLTRTRSRACRTRCALRINARLLRRARRPGCASTSRA